MGIRRDLWAGSAGEKMTTMKDGTVALVIKYEQGVAHLVESLSDDREIGLLELSLADHVEDPLRIVYDQREKEAKEDSEFGDYVEELLSQPFVRPEIQEHGVQWLKSKIRIEQYQKTEAEAAKVIADYAYRIFMGNPVKTDFYIAAPNAKVRVRIFVLEHEEASFSSNSRAA